MALTVSSVDNATGALASQLKGVTILGYANVYNNPGTGLYINSLGRDHDQHHRMLIITTALAHTSITISAIPEPA